MRLRQNSLGEAAARSDVNVEYLRSFHMSDPLKRYLVIENEDDLTRVVFGILELLGPAVLTEVLDLSDQLSDECTVEFHERIDPRAERIPDVVITDTDATILVEIKRGTSLDVAQLQDEHDDLRRFGKGEKRLLFISGHESSPSELDKIELASLEWHSWEAIARRLAKYDRTELSKTQMQLHELLRKTLEEEGYSPFAGFSGLEELPTVFGTLHDYHNQIARFHRKIEGLLGEQRLQAKNMWRNGISQDFNRFPKALQFASTHVWLAYGEPSFAIRSKDQHYLFVAFCIERERPMVRVGYSLSPKRSKENRTALSENADAIVDFVADTDSSLLQTDRNFRIEERFDDKKEMTNLLNATDTLGDLDRVQIAREYGSETLQQEAVTNLVADTLIEFHEFTYPRLYPCE